MDNNLETNNCILATNTFTITSTNTAVSCIESLRILKNQHIVIHIIHFSETEDFFQILKNSLENIFPNAQIVFLEHDDKQKIYLTAYALKSELSLKDANNKIFSKLYKDNRIKESNIKDYQNKLFNRYFIDHLTNLPNLYQLRHDLEESDEFSLIILNIDNFQIINNFYGLTVGDFVIEQVGIHLKENLKEYKIYRLSGNEFALVIDRSMFFYDLKEHLRELYEELKQIVIQYQKIDIFIDITLASSATSNKTNIFSKVEMALKHAKELGVAFWIYEDRMNFEHNYQKNIYLTKLIREAINNNKILPYYQAIVDNKTSKVIKYESLARLIDSDGNILTPNEFIPISKQIKSYSTITKTIINKTFEAFENSDIEFTINLAIEDIVSNEIFRFIMDKLKHSKVSHMVTFEILESDAIDDFLKVERFIKEAKRYGAKIAIDDFGEGYSNFSYLTKIDIDFLKIDGSLIKDIHNNKNSFLVVQAIVDFANKLGIKTIAEFVHSHAVMEIIKELGIDYSQGYHIGKPSLFNMPRNTQ
ncbi:MAG: EAL domain-containing protein [Campylobacterota bacterium]|nr:EAL domain-containing protein [Campylobacterota bacterium]